MRGVVLLVVAGLLLGACRSEVPPPSPTPTAIGTEKPTLTRYDSYWFSFEYPSTWDVLAHYVACGSHGPTVVAAVGIGSIDFQAFPPAGPGDHPRPKTEVGPATITNTEYCPATPNWTVQDAGVVVAYYHDSICCPLPPPPRRTLAPGEEFTVVDGVEVVRLRTGSSVVWHLYAGGPVFIEARWGRHAAPETEAQVEALVESWEWLSAEEP